MNYRILVTKNGHPYMVKSFLSGVDALEFSIRCAVEGLKTQSI